MPGGETPSEPTSIVAPREANTKGYELTKSNKTTIVRSLFFMHKPRAKNDRVIEPPCR